MDFDEFKEALGIGDQAAISHALESISSSIALRIREGNPLSQEERAITRDIVDQARALRFQEFVGSDPAARSADRMPERHHYAAYSVVRALAEHDREPVNDFADDRVRSVYESHRHYLERRASDPTINKDAFVSEFTKDGELDVAAASGELRAHILQGIQFNDPARLLINGQVRDVIAIHKGNEADASDDTIETKDGRVWGLNEWLTAKDKDIDPIGVPGTPEQGDRTDSELTSVAQRGPEIQIDGNTARRLAAARARDREAAFRGLGDPDAEFIEDLESRMAAAGLKERGWRDRNDISDVMGDLERLAASNWKLAAELWEKYAPGEIDKPVFIDGDDVDPPDADRNEPGNRLSRDTEKDKGKDGDDGRVVTPEALLKRYLQAQNKYYFRDEDKEGLVAFEDKGKRISTEHNDPAVARSMVELAEAKGWSALKVKGTEEFRREVWLQASLRGLQIQGYQPRDVDLAKLQDLQKEEARDKSRNSIERAPERERATPSAGPLDKEAVVDEQRAGLSQRQLTAIETIKAVMRERGDSEKAVEMAANIAAERFNTDRIFVGTVLEHGPAPYEHKEGGEPNYYIKLQTSSGERTVWGVDLDRAVTAGKANVGDQIALAYQGFKTVTVTVKERDESGKVIGEKEITTNRNSWDVSRLDAVRDAAREKLLEAASRAERQPLVKVYDRDAPRTAVRPNQVRVRQQDRQKVADIGRE